MKYNILVLGASYGSLFSTKLLMAGHRVSMGYGPAIPAGPGLSPRFNCVARD